MSTILKDKILNLIHNLNVKGYNKTRVNNAVDEIIENAGSGGSLDEGIAIFSVEPTTIEPAEEGESPKQGMKLLLVQGKPELADPESPHSILRYVVTGGMEYDISQDVIWLKSGFMECMWFRDNSDLLNFKPGDYILLDMEDAQVFDDTPIAPILAYISTNKSITTNFDNLSIEEIASVATFIQNNNVSSNKQERPVGRIIKIVNLWQGETMLDESEVYISINNEVWKYTFNKSTCVFTFVEVVS